MKHSPDNATAHVGGFGPRIERCLNVVWWSVDPPQRAQLTDYPSPEVYALARRCADSRCVRRAEFAEDYSRLAWAISLHHGRLRVHLRTPHEDIEREGLRTESWFSIALADPVRVTHHRRLTEVHAVDVHRRYDRWHCLLETALRRDPPAWLSDESALRGASWAIPASGAASSPAPVATKGRGIRRSLTAEENR